MILTKKEIKDLIPHRDPFLFLDRCNIIEIGCKGVGYRYFPKNEFFASNTLTAVKLPENINCSKFLNILHFS